MRFALYHRLPTFPLIIFALGLGLLIFSSQGCRQSESKTLDLGASGRVSWIEPGHLSTLEIEDPRDVPYRDLAGQFFDTELGHVMRRAAAQTPGHSLSRRLRAPTGASLQTAIGVFDDGQVTPVDFRVFFGKAELWHQQVSTRGLWTPVEVDIPPSASESELRLEVETSPDAPALAFWGHPRLLAPGAKRPGPGVLLISVDTLRADRLSFYGHDKPTSPHLDAWAENAAVFEKAVASAPWTLPSHMSMLTGINAFRHGINHDVGRRRPDLDSPGAAHSALLAELLDRSGFSTAAFTGGAYMHPKYGFNSGFDSYAYWPDRGRSEQELATGVDRALDFMTAKGERPFFFFLHTYDVHDPYLARQPFFSELSPELGTIKGRIALESPKNSSDNGFRQINRYVHRKGKEKIPLGEADRDLLEAFYDSNVAHADAEIGRLLAGIKDLGLDKRTLVILTSDHGEALLDDGEAAGHVELYDHTLLVPLIFAFPDQLGAGRRFENQVRSIDIVPTVLDWLGLELPDTLDGVSLVELLADRPTEIPSEAWSYSAAANRGLSLRFDNQLKVILDNNAWLPQGQSQNRHKVFDLGRDPTEISPLGTDGIGAWPARVAELFDQTAAGLRLQLINRGTGHLSGTIKGPMVRPVGTKSHDLTCDCLQWVELENASFDLPPGESFTLHFEKVFGRKLHLKGKLTRGEETFNFADTFDVRRLTENAILRFDGTSWNRDTQETAPIQEGFVVGWNGGIREHSASPAEQDPELRKQLEALGYL